MSYSQNSEIYQGARTWTDRCLLDDLSVFTDKHLWTDENLEAFRMHFIENFIEGEETFFEKLEQQLSGGKPELAQFAAELIWVLYLFPSVSMLPKTKREQITRVWEWSGDPFPDAPLLPLAFDCGLGNPGIAFQTHRWREVTFLWRVVGEFKSLDFEVRKALLSDPWDFIRWLDDVEDAPNRAMRNILPHLLFPKSFERTAANSHKKEIRSAFADLLVEGLDFPEGLSKTAKLDFEISTIRKRLEEENPGSEIDFYQDPWVEKWNPTPDEPDEPQSLKVAEGSSAGVQRWVIAPGKKGKHWEQFLENGVIAIGWPDVGDLRGYSNRDALQEALSEHYDPEGSNKNSGLGLWNFARTMKPGDILFAKSGRKQIIGRGVVTSDYRFDENVGDFPHIRSVDWQSTRTVDLPANIGIPTKTLTSVDQHPEFVAFVESFYAEDSEQADRRHWWLNASPKIWDFNAMAVGETQTYTALNEKGNKRQKYKYFEQVRPGDMVIGYLSHPSKQIVAICEITKGMKETDGVGFEFQKLEDVPRPIAWENLKGTPQLRECEPILNNQGSLFKLTADEFEFLRNLIDEQEVAKEAITPYSREDALKDLFMSEEEFDRILSLLKRKKNIVLQGPPGVGKTFVARRLAYALMKQKDEQRAPMVQFHQSYSYEDFIQGFRPDGNGSFHLRSGTFHTLCRQAQRDIKNDYFLIIDEINRGNLSKIFGELMMLMEADKRGSEFALQLTYSESSEDTFYIPENLHLIGTMNTADRSLALVDYALRRRFAFINLEPELESKAFHETLQSAGAGVDLIDRIRTRVGALNLEIRKDDRNLGRGYCIGHSFFCPPEKGTADEAWYREVIEYEIAPLLREYWVDDEDRAKTEIDKLVN